MSLYKDFIREATSFTCHETSKYFFTYSFNGSIFWIKNLYVAPELRGTVTKEVKSALTKLILDTSPRIVMWETYEECPNFKKITYMSKAVGAKGKRIRNRIVFYVNKDELLARLK